MSNWDESVHGEIGLGTKMPERCKPDYEAKIKECKGDLERLDDFTNALERMLLAGPRIVKTSNLKDLLGHCVYNQSKIRATIDELIKLQEEDRG